LDIKATVSIEDKRKIKHIAYKVLAEYSKRLYENFVDLCDAAGVAGFKRIKI
jgi:hypothetical protein